PTRHAPTSAASPRGSPAGIRHSFHARQDLDERSRRLPLRRGVTNGCRIEIQEADKDLADDARADRAKTVAVAADVSLAQDVIPERRVTAPAGRRGADFLTG